MSYNPPHITDEAKKTAAKFFQHAQTAADSRSFDYAIELYVQGLAKDPEAVEKGHMALREVGIRRTNSGGKKPGLMESLKISKSKKDPIGAMLAAEMMLAKDPLNLKYAEEMVKAADKSELPETLRWALQVYFELCPQEKKINVQRLLLIKSLYEKLGDFYQKQDRLDQTLEAYEKGIGAMNYAVQSGQGGSLDLQSELKNLATKHAILRGKYERGDFRDSIKDADAQKLLQDKSRQVKGEELLTQLIEKARAEADANPSVGAKVFALIDLLTQRGKPEDEKEAIKILDDAHQRTGQYSFKMRADDLRIRHQRRAVKRIEAKVKAEATPDPTLQQQLADARQQQAERELAIFKERIEQYPTDTRLKFEYGRRLYESKRYDEAIPVFQEAVGDPRHAVRARYYIGTCFFQKGWHSQAIDILNEAVERYETLGDALSKEIFYVLGRSHEELEQIDQALKIYSRLIQWDFNYRDVRHRIDKLQAKKKINS